MARADLLKTLFLGYQRRDHRMFEEAAAEIVKEERRKNHPVVANELERIIKNGGMRQDSTKPHQFDVFEAPPQDPDRKSPLAEVKRPCRYFGDLVIDDRARGFLDRLITEYRDWEVLLSHGLPPVHRILFCGPSGCGKTATAEAISSELSLPLLYVRFDAVVSSLLGETASNIRKVFDYASRGQWVILFDEFDSIGRSRDDETEHGEIKRVVNSFLQIMDNFEGRSLVIAATNFEQALDPAVWRRFDEVIRFERPTDEQLQALVKKCLKSIEATTQHHGEIVSALSTATFADAERVCLDIRRACAVRGDKAVKKGDVSAALDRHRYRQSIMSKVAHTGSPSILEE